MDLAFQELRDPEPEEADTPSLYIPSNSQRSRSRSDIAPSLISSSNSDSNEQKASPYEKFEAKALARHPSLTRQQSKQLSPVKDASLKGNLQHAASSPALQKILSEDNEFGEELRRRSELKDDGSQRKRHLRILQPSIELRTSIEKDLSSKEIIIPGLPSSPKNTRKRLELRTDLDLAKGKLPPEGLVPVSVEIDIENESRDHGSGGVDKLENRDSAVKVKPKKKKYVLKKKKVKKITEPTILEEGKEHTSLEGRKVENGTDGEFICVTGIPDEYHSGEAGYVYEQEASQMNNEKENKERKTPIDAFIEEEKEAMASESKDEMSAVEKISIKATDDKVARAIVNEEKKKEKDGKKSKLKRKAKEKKDKKSEKEKKSAKKKGKANKQDEESDWVVIDLKGNFTKNSFV